MIGWGGLAMAVGVFTDPLFVLIGLIQISTSIVVCVILNKPGFGNTFGRLFTFIYLCAVCIVCGIGAYATPGNALPAVFVFMTMSLLAIAGLVEFRQRCPSLDNTSRSQPGGNDSKPVR